MPPYIIRSTIFNICFYVLTGVACVALLPTLLLPRKAFLAVVYGFVHTATFLEKYILGLTYEIRGQEHIPKNSSYIVAAKHQSAYETLKLHILFGDPAIVLKKELLKIPLWGKYLSKSDVIAIDRSSPKLAIKSLQNGAKHVKEQGRPIVIFPQGTRVAVEVSAQEKPYKIGIMRIQEATDIPIIPMALNTGVFYPRHKWCKKPGRVIFEFLPPILPSKQKTGDVLKNIEMSVEEKTAHLIKEGLNSIPKRNKIKSIGLITLTSLALLYTLNWFVAAYLVNKSIKNKLSELKENTSITEFNIATPVINGFPGKLNLSIGKSTIASPNERLEIESMHAQSWPFLGMPITIETGKIRILTKSWNKPFEFQSLNGEITHKSDILTINKAALTHGETLANLAGTIDSNIQPTPSIDLDLEIENQNPFIKELTKRKLIKKKHAMLVNIALKALEKDGVVRTQITSHKNKIYLGPIKILEIPTKDSQ